MSCSHYEERVEKVELPQLKVNGVAIGEDLLARELQYHPADSYALALEAACRALIVRQLLLQRADALGIEARCEDGDAGGSAHPPIAGGRGAGPGSRRRRLPDLVRGQSGTPARPLAPAIAPCAAGLRAGRPGGPRDGAQAGRGAARRIARASRALRRPGPAFFRLPVEGVGWRPRLDRAGADRPRIREAPAAPRARAARASAGKPLWPACGGTAGARRRRAARLRRGPRTDRRAPASAGVAASGGTVHRRAGGRRLYRGLRLRGCGWALVQ